MTVKAPQTVHNLYFAVFSINSEIQISAIIFLIRLSLYQTENYLGPFGSDSYLEFSSHYIQKEKSLSADPHDHIEPQQIKEYSIICASHIRKERKELNHSLLLQGFGPLVFLIFFFLTQLSPAYAWVVIQTDKYGSVSNNCGVQYLRC